MNSSTSTPWTGQFQVEGMSLFIKSMFNRNSVFDANSVDTDQMPHSVASDLGLHCLPMSLFLDAGHKWVNCDGRVKAMIRLHKCTGRLSGIM